MKPLHQWGPGDLMGLTRYADSIAWGVDAVSEYYGETLTQHLSETHLYGDSWPGAQIQLRNTEVTYNRLVRVHDALQAMVRLAEAATGQRAEDIAPWESPYQHPDDGIYVTIPIPLALPSGPARTWDDEPF